MKKCLVILEAKKHADRAEGIFRSMNIKWERIWPDRYHVWLKEDDIKHLNETFEFMSCIRTE